MPPLSGSLDDDLLCSLEFILAPSLQVFLAPFLLAFKRKYKTYFSILLLMILKNVYATYQCLLLIYFNIVIYIFVPLISTVLMYIF